MPLSQVVSELSCQAAARRQPV